VCIVALEQTLKAESNYGPELLTDFANTLNRVLESIGRLHQANDREMTATDTLLLD